MPARPQAPLRPVLARPAVLALAACLLVAGCSGAATDAPQADAAARTSASAAPSSGAPGAAGPGAAPSPGPTQPCAPFTGPAADEFGADSVMDACQLATEVVSDAGFDGALVNTTGPTQADLARFEQHMTPELAREWRADTERIGADTNDQQTFEDVFALVTFGVPGLVEGGQPVEDPVRNAGFGGARASVGTVTLGGRTEPSLVLAFPVTGEFLLADAAGTVLVTTITKDMTVTLLPTGDAARPWAIHAYEADRDVSEPVPAPADLVAQTPARP